MDCVDCNKIPRQILEVFTRQAQLLEEDSQKHPKHVNENAETANELLKTMISVFRSGR